MDTEKISDRISMLTGRFDIFWRKLMNGAGPDDTGDCGAVAIAVMCAVVEIEQLALLRAYWKDRPTQEAFAHSLITLVKETNPELAVWIDCSGRFDGPFNAGYFKRKFRTDEMELRVFRQTLEQAAAFWIHHTDELAVPNLFKFGDELNRMGVFSGLEYNEYTKRLARVVAAIEEQKQRPKPDTMLMTVWDPKPKQ